MTIARRIALVGAWLAVLAGALVGLAAAGHGQLATPPVTSGTTALRAWTRTRDAPTILMTGLRLVAIALAWYLIATTVLGAVARALHLAAAVRWTDAVSVPAVRRLLGGATGLLLSAAPIAVTMAPAAPAARNIAFRLHQLAPGVTTAPRLSIVLPAAPEPDPPPLLTPLPGPPVTWTVAPGDSCWLIASRTLAAAWNRPPSDAETVPYWEAVIAANRTRFADPANPSLIFPAQELTLPPPPPAP